MVAKDEDALLCDMAETYHIIDWRALPLHTAAALAFGLPESSRIKLRLAGAAAPRDTLLMASAVDYLALLWWRETENGQHNRKRPKSLVSAILGAANKKDDLAVFDTAEDFEKRRAQLLRGGLTNGC